MVGIGLLGDDIQCAAGGAAAVDGRRRPFEDLDLLGEEILADAHRGIADAVDEDVVAGIEAADEKAVAEGVAALAGAERDARGGARHVLEAGGVLVLEDFLGEDGDALWRIGDRLGELRRRQAVRLIRRRWIRIGVAVGGRSVGSGRLGLRLGLRRLLGARGAAQRGADAQLLRRGFRRRRALALDRRLDLDRRQCLIFGLGAADRGDRHQAADGDFSRCIGVERRIDAAAVDQRSQRPRRCYDCHFRPRFPFPSPRCRAASQESP